MQFPSTVGVTFSSEPPMVLVNGQTNNRDVVVSVSLVILVERDALLCQIALYNASIWSGHVTNESFDDPINPLERHNVVQVWRATVDDVVHNVDTQMHHDVKERGREVHLELT